ncbi:MAG: hypothetical protein A2901_08320 [Elusimicrobia bacterium RIFCSPLOWO2_01_FULL_54_10]|nr:MAG: hypothetical protein A2901_08320 [Elusimicrobia bacterium RIFCSPLOWO2_01_FULL_54_10]
MATFIGLFYHFEMDDMTMVAELDKIFVYIVVPGLAGITFFALAKFVRHIMPLRALVSSPQTYHAAFWGFMVFGFYLGLRPVQVLAGPHPWPLIVSSLREFLLIGIFGPAAFIGMLTLCFGPEKIGKAWIGGTFGLGVLMALTFCVVNGMAIGGSEEIVRMGRLTAYDGLWYKNKREDIDVLMQILFYIRLVNPGALLLVAGSFILYHAVRYPPFKKRLYDNMPKKLYILSIAVFIYSLSIIGGSLLYTFRKVPDQWGIYHLGSLIAGFLEAISLSMPVKSDVQVSEHRDSPLTS